MGGTVLSGRGRGGKGVPGKAEGDGFFFNNDKC